MVRSLELSETDAAIKARVAEDARAARKSQPSQTKRMLTEFIGGLGGG